MALSTSQEASGADHSNGIGHWLSLLPEALWRKVISQPCQRRTVSETPLCPITRRDNMRMAHVEPLPESSIAGVIQTQREAIGGNRVLYLLLLEQISLWKQYSMSLEGTTERKAVVRPQERIPSQKVGSFRVTFLCASCPCSLPVHKPPTRLGHRFRRSGSDQPHPSTSLTNRYLPIRRPIPSLLHEPGTHWWREAFA